MALSLRVNRAAQLYGTRDMKRKWIRKANVEIAKLMASFTPDEKAAFNRWKRSYHAMRKQQAEWSAIYFAKRV